MHTIFQHAAKLQDWHAGICHLWAVTVWNCDVLMA